MIILDKLDIYGRLDFFQFVKTQRIYIIRSVKLIDIITFREKTIDELLICVYDDESVAEICSAATQVMTGPMLFAKTEKATNKREKHEVTACDRHLFLQGEYFTINKIFIRAELEKKSPERLVIDY